MKKKLNENFLNLSIFTSCLFFLITLSLAVIHHLLFSPVFYLPFLILFLYILILIYISSQGLKIHPFLVHFDEVEAIFYFWYLLIFQEPLLVFFPMVHLVLDDTVWRLKYQVGKLVIYYLLTASSACVWYYANSTAPTLVIRQILMMILFLTIGLLINRYIKKLRADDLKNIKALNRQIRSKNLLFSTMSHELRTPLTMIQSAASLLIEERPGKINEMQRTFLQTVDRNTTRLIDLTESILTRIKIETTWLKLNSQKIDIQTVIRDVINQVDPVIHQEDKSIDFTHPKLLPSINGDYNWLSQVMINLIHNAKKNIDIGGKIFIHVKENEQFIVVSVSDNGTGVDDKNKSLVYDEFYSENKHSNVAVEGIGMGLAIVKFVIEKHGGKIYMGSIAGLGTTFSFTLPKIRSHQ
jgi:signal transduction histidine kinase